MKNLAVFVSGSGTNLENLAVKIKERELERCQIQLVVCDKSSAFALQRATKHGLKTLKVQRGDFPSKEKFEAAIIKELKANKIDYIVLAGFMRILSAEFIRGFSGRIINIHPALLPEFPGAHAIKEAWDSKVPETGVTVHFVDEGVDTGPRIAQKRMKRFSNDTLETFENRIHQIEYDIYPQVLQWFVDDRLEVKNKEVYLDGKKLTIPVQL